MKALKSEDISSVIVIKDSLIVKKYDAEYGVLVITTKKYILETFYKDNIQNSPLKDNIKSPEDLARIGVVTEKDSKNQPYDELSKYIYTNTANKKIKKIASIVFINPDEAVNINPKWTFGAISISAEIE